MLVAALALYLGLVALEYYWNVPDWQPRWDLPGFLLLWWTCACAVLCSVFVALSTKATGRSVALLLSAALLALAIYLTPAEPKAPGLLGRRSASPGWYRGGRAGLLTLPFAIWMLPVLRCFQWKAPSEGRRGKEG